MTIKYCFGVEHRIITFLKPLSLFITTLIQPDEGYSLAEQVS